LARVRWSLGHYQRSTSCNSGKGNFPK
jgi:hypothetical protein